MENEILEQSTETVEQSSETSEQYSEVSDVSEIKEDIEESVHEDYKDLDKEEKEEEIPSSTVIQVTENSDSDLGYDITELDVNAINSMAEQFVEKSLAVTPSSNDYYAFIDSTIADYFSGVMANYPLNEYRAYHLRHWVYNSSYSSYYDDYFYLYYDMPSTDCIEIYKPHDSNAYQVSFTSAPLLSSTITYGSDEGLSDLREGVNYVSWLSALCVIGAICVLYIVNAIFRHIRS